VHHRCLCGSTALGVLVNFVSRSRVQLYTLSDVGSYLEYALTHGPVKRCAYCGTCTTCREDNDSVFRNFNITIRSQTFIYFSLVSILIYCTRPLAAVCY